MNKLEILKTKFKVLEEVRAQVEESAQVLEAWNEQELANLLNKVWDKLTNKTWALDIEIEDFNKEKGLSPVQRFEDRLLK